MKRAEKKSRRLCGVGACSMMDGGVSNILHPHALGNVGEAHMSEMIEQRSLCRPFSSYRKCDRLR